MMMIIIIVKHVFALDERIDLWLYSRTMYRAHQKSSTLIFKNNYRQLRTEVLRRSNRSRVAVASQL